jgi:hypothetical protein
LIIVYIIRHAQTLTSSHSTRSALPRTVLGVEGKELGKKYLLGIICFLASQIPYVKQFVLSKSTQYRKLKTEWRQNTYLAKSRIQVSSVNHSRALCICLFLI